MRRLTWSQLGIAVSLLALTAACISTTAESSTTTVSGISTPAPSTTSAPVPATTVTWKDLSIRPHIWFGPLDPWSWGQFYRGAGPFQFYDLFTEDAPWPRAAEAVGVMRLYPVWLESFATRGQLEDVFEDLGRRGIAISFELGPLTETAACNASTVEGFAGAGPALNIARRIRQAGGVLHSMDLEHPFDAASYGPLACRMSPVEIARDSLTTIEAVRSIFPEVLVGSIETADLDPEAVAAWLDGYREVTGEHLAYFHLDSNFAIPDWSSRAKAIEEVVRSRGVEFGIIYFGDAEDTSDEEWLARAEERFVEYEVITGGKPDHAIFQSWHTHPERLLPETDAGTFTYLINRYMRPRSVLEVAFVDAAWSGSLTAEDSTPLAGATIQLSGEPVSGPGLVGTYTISGTVPAGATGADVGYRINTECNCSGQAELTLHEATYMEAGSTSNLVPNGDFSQGLEGWGTWGSASYGLVDSDIRTGNALRVSAAPGLDAGLNSGTAAVTAGAGFTMTVTARVDPVSAGSGYFQIIFLNPGGEVERRTIPLAAARVDLGVVETGVDGRFELSGTELGAGVRLRAWFAGDASHWPALAIAEASDG